MKEKIVISPESEVYELMMSSATVDGICTMEEHILDLENATLEEAIAETLTYYYYVTSATLFKKTVYSDEQGNKYYSEPILVMEIKL